MSQQQINEKQLLTKAEAWFREKYAKPPKECDVKFIKVWYKPTPLRKIPAVVFAPTEEIGNAFIWEQNALFRILKNFLIAVVSFCIVLFVYIYALAQGDSGTASAIAITSIILYFCAFLFLCYMAKKCKKLENIHKWNVEIYYLGM